jgi:hypothetical protein
MLRKVTVVIGLATALLVAREASAVQITPVDLDTLDLVNSIVPSLTDAITVAKPLPPTMGEITNNVFFDGLFYTYVHTVTPSLNTNFIFNTALPVAGFTGVAGWSFSEAGAAKGSAGTDADFFINSVNDQLNWMTVFGDFAGWNKLEPITFFFVSTKPPGIGDYNLLSTEAGTGQSYAPIPEPGSIALLGSGLVGLYAAMRRRRSLRG